MSVVVDVRGLPAVLASLDALDGRQRQNLERRAVRAAANIFKPALASAARAHHGGGENVPASFAKVKVKVTTRGGGSGRDVEAAVRPTSPLFNIFEPGAGAHEIAPKHGDLLGGPAGGGGWSAEGRKRRTAFAARGAVRHPGFRARPLLPGVFSAESGKAGDAAAAIIFGRPGAVLGAAE